MYNKKAQGEIITTVLIILLVLAAVVIVWQVVNSTVKGGASQIDKQSACIGISTEVTKIDSKTFAVKRVGGGTLTGTPTIKVIADGNTKDCTWPTGTTWTADLSSATCNVTDDVINSFEAGLVLGDGTACPIMGKWTK